MGPDVNILLTRVQLTSSALPGFGTAPLRAGGARDQSEGGAGRSAALGHGRGRSSEAPASGLPSKTDDLQRWRSGWTSREGPASQALGHSPRLAAGRLRQARPRAWRLLLAPAAPSRWPLHGREAGGRATEQCKARPRGRCAAGSELRLAGVWAPGSEPRCSGETSPRAPMAARPRGAPPGQWTGTF